MENSERIIAILSIGIITIMLLLAINIYKVKKLKKENDTLKQNLNK